MSRSKKKNNTRLLLGALLLVAAAAAAFIPTKAEHVATASATSVMPGYAELEKVKIPDGISNRIVPYEGFTVAFNRLKHQPNYVVWTLEPSETDGPYTRKNAKFVKDKNVRGCATTNDYRNSGFDRGHMAPAADMKWSEKAMADCHILTNICPQNKQLNAGAWATVETNSRKWAKKFGPLVIISGPVLSDKLTRTIGKTEIPVPERFFKVILAPEANPPMGIAFLMPNARVEGGAQTTVTTIDEIEAITGFDFFAALPDDIENQVESQSKYRQWNK